MTSGNFAIVPISLITVDREQRQRRELVGIDELAASISARGLINPIVVDENYQLIAGERRYTACMQLGLTEIPVQFIGDLPEIERQLIELEENIKREDLAWQDYVASVARIHAIYKQTNDNWTTVQTGNTIGLSDSWVRRILLVQRNMEHPLVKAADKLSVAVNAATRYEERQEFAATKDIASVLAATPVAKALEPVAAKPVVPVAPSELHNLDFADYIKQFNGPKFNLIHCDFPYGVNVGADSGQAAGRYMGEYKDKPDDFFNLITLLMNNLEKLTTPGAHLMFWYSMDFHEQTKQLLTDAGWTVNPFPLIWHKSDNTGILPDANRGPRRIYETALFATRGDRKVVKAVGNCFSGPVTKEFHPSEKSFDMLSHFFRMLVDDTTVMLDPTCGSGNSVRAAAKLGAKLSVGVERDLEFFTNAQRNLEKYL